MNEETQHLCAARGCARPIPHRTLMCSWHWRQVPRNLQQNVWKHYKTGQEKELRKVTSEYVLAAKAAIDYVASLERQQRGEA